MNYKKIAELIAKSKKITPAKVFLRGEFGKDIFKNADFQAFGEGRFRVLIGDYRAIEKWQKRHQKDIEDHYVEIIARHSALPLLDLRNVEARIEPGAVVRAGARIEKHCVIMMGAIINIGAVVGRRTMIDMNAVVGARAIIGKDCHIGAGAVIAGVLEPPSKKPVIIEDNVLVGANAVILEGVKIGRGSVVAAGAVVLKNIPPGVVAAGIPAKVVKRTKDVPQNKIALIQSLRGTR
jgi:2,3,4,5-tetrahydropyridine-2,6-dicarboxylate N-acetyltransferase